MLLAIVVGVIAWLALQLVVLMIPLVLIVMDEGYGAVDAWFNEVGQGPIDPSNPLEFSTSMLSLAALIPAAYVGYRVAGLRPVGVLASVRIRMRWGWLGRAFLPALAAIAFSLATASLLGVITGTNPEPIRMDATTMLVAFALTLALVPLQSAAEEVVFRGALLQALGSWLPNRRWALVVVAVAPLTLFVFGHDYNVWGMADVAAFALAATWVTVRTGGLEAAIALHVANNVLLSLLQSTGLLGDPAQASDGSVGGLMVSLVAMTGYCWAIEVMARREGIERYSIWPESGSVRRESASLAGSVTG